MDEYRFLLRERLADLRDWIDKRNRVRFELVLLACLAVGLTVIISTAYLPALRGFAEGEPAPRTVVAARSVTALDAEATAALRERVAQLVEPVYRADPEALPAATAALESFLREAGRLRAEVAAGKAVAEAIQELGAAAPPSASAAALTYVLTADGAAYDRLQRQILGALTTVYYDRITEESLDAALQTLRSVADSLAVSPQAADALYLIAAGYVRPNQVVDEEQTRSRREAAMKQVAPVLVSVREGETVVQQGETVTAQDLVLVEALGLTGPRSGYKVYLGIFFLVLLETAVFSRLLSRFNKGGHLENNMLLALVTLMLAGTAVARLLIIEPLSPYIIPVAAMGMVVAVILNARSALLLVTLSAINIGLLTDLDMRFALVGLVVGALSLYLVSRVTQRAALLGAGLATMVLAFVTIFFVETFKEASFGDALTQSLWGLANGALAGVLTVILLLILDSVFNLTTPLRLLELANPAQPLLKKMLQVAPGTYNHSIQMGNLAEAAAEAIGADPLLARVGAYYHDIGKTVRPEYFVENQIYVENPHNRLNPNLSKLAITAHVRDGEHLARLYGLPQPVVDIIKQHHGTSVLAYFYHKALEESADQVYEESYRYEEQKPRSKEAAIIMLADGVEAAVRAMQNPTRRKIQGVIQEIIKQKVEDGQLDESDLTQGDLHKIQESFDASLRGLVGHRISYPDRDGQQERKRPAGRGTPPSAALLREGGQGAGPAEEKPADPVETGRGEEPADG
jgi:hypothetical protein